MADNFDLAFVHVADEIHCPDHLRQRFCTALRAAVDDPRAATRVAEAWLAQYPFAWLEGECFVREWQHQRGTSKQLAAEVARYVVGRWMVLEQWGRLLPATDSHPYLLLERGPVSRACPLHGDHVGLVLPVGDAYWIRNPLRATVFCRCRVRQISRMEFDRLRNHGLIVPAP